MRWTAGFAALIVLAVTSFLAVYLTRPPAPKKVDAPATSFSAERAMAHVAAIAKAPHPPGTAEHTAVREYIIGQLKAAGLEPELYRAQGLKVYGQSTIEAAMTTNVVARLRGTSPTRAVMLASHYDSVPTGPGASDDGAAVAAMLETLRALKAGQPLQNDVIFLFTDAEELGLLGSQAFVDGHPWMKEAGLVLNFEARGTGGPAIMFEVSDQNGRLMSEFARAVATPSSTSVAYEVYRRLPNDTDVTEFKRVEGLDYLNVAYIGHWTRYHTALDNVANVDRGGLQQMGEYALGVASHFGSLSLPLPAAGNAVWFNALRWWLVHYPAAWAIPLAVVSAVLMVVVLVFGFCRRTLTVSGTALGLAALVLLLVTAVGLTMGVKALIPIRAGVRYEMFPPAYAALVVVAALVIYGRVLRRVQTADLTAGAAVLWLALALATPLLIPGGSYLFLWPLVFVLGGLAYACWKAEPPGALWAMTLGGLPAILLAVPLVLTVFDGLATLPEAPVALLALMAGLLAAPLRAVWDLGRWWAPAAALLTAIAVVVPAVLLPPNALNPMVSAAVYGLDADSGKAYWLVRPVKATEWSSQFGGDQAVESEAPEFFPYLMSTFRRAPAPQLVLPAPELDVVSDHLEGSVRTLQLRLRSPRKAHLAEVYLQGPVEVLGSTVGGMPVLRTCALGENCIPWYLRYSGLPAEGVEITLRVKTGQPVSFRVIDTTFGLPDIPGAAVQPRQDSMIPGVIPDGRSTDSVRVSRKVKF